MPIIMLGNFGLECRSRLPASGFRRQIEAREQFFDRAPVNSSL